MNIPPVSMAACKAALLEQYASPMLRRSRTAERALDQAGAHLARAMAAAPGRFHDEHRLAR